LGLEAGYAPAMDGCGTVDHEGVGADFIRKLGLKENIAYLTQQHVSAKRYLCNRNKGYQEGLSEASKTTLKHQGGPMTDEEASKAESDPRWKHVLTMRYIDEAAKEPNMKIPKMKDILRPLIEANMAPADKNFKVGLFLFLYLHFFQQFYCSLRDYT
jgi:2-amino-1-hydroxyethylphosphonate dioxygenase (glycine-forming)